jgi:predicted CXXCH cytochrome family protein
MARRTLAVLVALAASGCAHASPAPPPAPAAAPAAAVPPAAPAPSAAAPSGARAAEFTPVPDLEAAHAVNPHDHGGKPLCQRCHVAGAVGVKEDPISLCAGCHDPAAMKHPFRMAPAAPPQGLPLMAGGLVACHTCHDPHDVKARPSGLRLEYSELCLRCHVRHGTKPGAAP